MNKITLGLFSIISIFFLSACEGLEDDAKDTPIGSVVSGKTRDPEDYVERVRERNRAAGHDVWRPENTESGGF